MPAHAAGNRAPGLRLATYNVAGLHSASRVLQFLTLFRHLRLDIVCLQETWVGHEHGATQAQVTLWLAQATLPPLPPLPSYTAFWAHNNLHDGHRAGVAILVRTALLHTLTFRPITSTLDGRLLVASLLWAGHSFTLANCYWPATTAGDQRQFLRTVLTPSLAAVRPGSLVLVGDFNHVPNHRLDRTPLPGQAQGVPNPDRQAETATSQELQNLLGHRHSLCDAFRTKHPTTKGWTRFHTTSAARLDQIYVPQPLLQYVHSCKLFRAPISDHIPLILHLLPAQPCQPRGHGLRPPPLDFLRIPALKAQMALRAARLAAYGLTLSPSDLLAWWPICEATIVAAARSAGKEQRAGRTPAQAALPAARQAMEAAAQNLEQAQPEEVPAALALAAALQAVYRRHSQAAAAPAATTARATWLHQGERPSPLLTLLTRPPRHSGPVLGLRGPTADIITDNLGMANCMVRHYAHISATPQVSPHHPS